MKNRVKMSVITFENNGKNISENMGKLKLEENIKSLLFNHLVYTCAEETEFWQFHDKLTKTLEPTLTVHS